MNHNLQQIYEQNNANIDYLVNIRYKLNYAVVNSVYQQKYPIRSRKKSKITGTFEPNSSMIENSYLCIGSKNKLDEWNLKKSEQKETRLCLANFLYGKYFRPLIYRYCE